MIVEPMDVDRADTVACKDHPSSSVKVLKGHESEVFTCTWSPVGNILLTGSVIIIFLHYIIL